MSPLKVRSATKGERELLAEAYSKVSEDPFVFLDVGKDGKSGVLELRPSEKLVITSQTPEGPERRRNLIPTLEISLDQGRTVTIFDNSTKENVVLSWEPNWQERLAQIKRQAWTEAGDAALIRRFRLSSETLRWMNRRHLYVGCLPAIPAALVDFFTFNLANSFYDWKTGRIKKEEREIADQMFDEALAQAGMEIVRTADSEICPSYGEIGYQVSYEPLPFGEIPEHARPEVLKRIDCVQRDLEDHPGIEYSDCYYRNENDPSLGIVNYKVRAKE